MNKRRILELSFREYLRERTTEEQVKKYAGSELEGLVTGFLLKQLDGAELEKENTTLDIQNINKIDFRENCEYKDAPCKHTGKGWYDRCAWCSDNNGFKRKAEDASRPF